MVVLGTIRSFLEPFWGHLSPKIDKVSEELNLRYPHGGPCVGTCIESHGETHQKEGHQGHGKSMCDKGVYLGDKGV